MLTVTAVPTDHRVVVASPPADPQPAEVWPLTGLSSVDATAEAKAAPSLDVKIENTPDARPQKGLEYADIVFEEYVEYGVSRLMAVFQSTFPDSVGPVRSLRPMDPNIAGSFNGAVVFSGANAGVLRDAKKTGELLLAQDLHSKGFFRVRTKPAPHNLWATVSALLEQASAKTAPPQQFDYAYPSSLASAAVSGTPTTHVAIRLSKISKPTWDWDSGSGTWLRSETSGPMMTFDGARISATNVVVLRVNVRYVYGFLPETLMFVDHAPGFVLTDGKYLPILWSKADRTDTIHLVTETGAPVDLAPGKTWVELLPRAGSKDTQSIDFG